ncbi:PREDICTED: RPM1-interacting protein 4-like [Nicotiana attenuata]|nr:PREDICTED: RPM1-interacting protein 4-like [Nicotiana attenuata]
MAQGSHVPKFGNWDGDNVPYTAYFENARKGKGGKMINPNDPEENPEAFAYRGYEDASINVSPAKTPLIETPQYNYGHRRNPSDDLSNYSSASVPKFGAWDEKDPKSGEGFTVIFNKVKEEKQIAAAKFPIVQPQPNMPSSHKRNTKSKMFCCLF